MTRDPAGTGKAPPEAVLKPRHRLQAAWLIPAAAVVLAVYLGSQAWVRRGVSVSVRLAEGHGLKAGDEVRYRGITVGEVRAVYLAEKLEGVVVEARLSAQADRLARAGSRFWVVRPRLGIGGIEGLETLIGPRYLAVLPGQGRLQRRFVGLSEPPVVEAFEPGDLEIILSSDRLGTMGPGAPVTYRQVRVGTVVSVGLRSDGGGVEARVHVGKAYIQLIREGTRFWITGGMEAKIGLGGVSLELESLAALLAGGVALATPPDAGEVVHTGHRFALEPEPPDGWVDWQPLAVIGSSMLPAGASRPNPMRAKLAWRQGRFISRARTRQGWVLPTTEGLLGPADLLLVNDKADRETIELEVAGRLLPLTAAPVWTDGGLAMVRVGVMAPPWPANRWRRPKEPEDCLAVGDPTAAPLPLAAALLGAMGGGWNVDPAVSVDESWHGACVVARADGDLIGLLLVEDDTVRVALVPNR